MGASKAVKGWFPHFSRVLNRQAVPLNGTIQQSMVRLSWFIHHLVPSDICMLNSVADFNGILSIIIGHYIRAIIFIKLP